MRGETCLDKVWTHPASRVAMARQGKAEAVETQGEYFSDWFERQYARHPKKKNRVLAEQAAAEAFTAGSFKPEDFEAAHVIWCESEEWAWKNGAAAPPLDQWIVDKGYNYLPKSYAPPVAPEVPLWRKELLARPLEEN